MKKLHNSEEIHKVMCELMKMSRMHHSRVENKINKLGIHRSQHMALMYISKNDGNVTQKDISGHYGISEAAVSATVKKLETQGFVCKINNPNDARYNSLKLTDKGLDVVKKSVDIFNAAEAETFENISGEELNMLRTLILKMQSSIRAESDGDIK
ncbi:MAG: winged helix-turn-helix transcriptional regulator [Ruminococcaceae bacterium]|nr:winged helix-turn-helix transcriptional regulator [Oscillospiraceae bacterium]